MPNIFSFLLPGALVLSSSLPLHAEILRVADAAKSPEKTKAAPTAAAEEKTQDPDDPRHPAPVVAPEAEGTALDAEGEREGEAENKADDGDTESSSILRQSQKTSAEAFVDYNTFLGNRQNFTPLAYGVKAYCFHNSDTKFGLSLAREELSFGFDKKTLQTPVRRKGSALRVAAHGQFFLSNSLNIEASIFGASGTMKAGDGFIEDSYSRTGITLAFGNQWSWHDYTFGLDWLTLTYNSTLRVAGQNVLDLYPSNRNGGMIVLSALSFGMAW